MEEYVETVDVTFIVEGADGRPVIGSRAIRMLVPSGIDLDARESRLIGEAKAVVAAIHDVEMNHVCVTGISIRGDD